ncbi:MAG: hypothetical protein JHC26_04965 [Thermofilum sp.]|jgi:hypothetical protein|uniref:hypothetical protein n=1 Tax=Thermofilum sp. TaxID=1961369 RepID=UPI002583BCDC|nr:hypothetical protein [Thermofilum sp.]MCI4408420.1 hypothetical protein [Thermofilum sp.]
MNNDKTDKWELLKNTIECFYEHFFENVTVEDLDEKASNIFLKYVIGNDRVSRFGLLLVTRLGDSKEQCNAPAMIRIFFDNVHNLQPPFDFEGTIYGKTYQVKVVAGENTFNASSRKDTIEASRSYSNPIILTLQGRYFKPKHLTEKLVWLSAPSTWKLIAGQGGYTRFQDVLYQVASRYRERAWQLIKTRKNNT